MNEYLALLKDALICNLNIQARLKSEKIYQVSDRIDSLTLQNIELNAYLMVGEANLLDQIERIEELITKGF